MKIIRQRRFWVLLTVFLMLPTGLVTGDGESGGSVGSARKVQQTQLDVHDWTGFWDMSDSTDYTLSNAVVQKGHAMLATSPSVWDTVGPCSRIEHVTVWDSLHNSIIIQGGIPGYPTSAGEPLNDTWVYDISVGTWSRMADGPRRASHAGVWDSQNNQMLIFGGYSASGAQGQSGEVWAFDPATNTWTKKGGGSVARADHSAVWDPLNKQMLVFGGDAGLWETNDLWAYKPSTNTWSQKTSGATPRKNQAACWDSRDGMMLIFGGYPDKRDTWAYNPSTDQWTQYATLPGWSNDAGAVWDAENGQMVVMFNQEMWTFNPATNTYEQYYYFPLWGSPDTMVWNTRNSRIYYCAGAPYFYSFQQSSHVWRSEWGGYPELGHSAVWDTAHQQMILFGGESGAWSPYLYDTPETWAFSPSKGTWTRKADQPLGGGFTAVWDTRDNLAILYEGSTWTYNPATDTWKTCAAGPQRSGHRAVWDSQNSQMLVFGGSDGTGNPFNDVWTYNPSKDEWMMKNPGGTPPSPRYYPSAAWDAQSNRMLVFGGSYYDGSQTQYLSDLHAYSPSTNSWVSLASAPRAVARQTAVWDDAHNQMIICGGETGTTDIRDTWVYIPTTNSWAAQPGLLAGTRDHSAVWDTSDSQMLVFGGQNGSGALRALHSFEVPFAASGEIMAAPRLLGTSLVSIDRAVWNATVPDGTVIDIWIRTADVMPAWTNWTPIELGRTLSVQGKNFQWKAVLSSPQRHHSPILDNFTLYYIVDNPPAVATDTEFSAYRKETVFLNASALDADGDTLILSWSQSAGPAVDIQDTASCNASFIAEIAGPYSFMFSASDSYGGITQAFVNITVLNHRPRVFAPARLTAFRRDIVSLNGSGWDGDADALRFRWTQDSGPPVELEGSSSPVASFSPTLLGTYVFGLVANDSYEDSSTVFVTVTVENRVPIADAGGDIIAHRRETVLLKGSGIDGDGDQLSFNWSEIEGLPVEILNATVEQAGFFPTRLGRFTFQLVVNDDYNSSEPSKVNVTVVNMPPRAEAGSDKTVDVKGTVQLQGDGIDADGDPLSFRWVQTAGTTVSISDANTRVGTFVPDVPGTYSFRLIVNDTHDESSDIVNITVVDRSHPPRFTSKPPAEAHPGQLYRYTAKYADKAGAATCNLTLVTGPEGMVLRSGVVSWTPGAGQEGRFNASLSLTDGSSTVYQNWTIFVTSGSGGSSAGTPAGGASVYIGVLVAIIVVATVAGLIVRRRLRRAG